MCAHFLNVDDVSDAKRNGVCVEGVVLEGEGLRVSLLPAQVLGGEADSGGSLLADFEHRCVDVTAGNKNGADSYWQVTVICTI